MKANIHPQWHHDTVVTCSCGNTFVTGSTLKTIQVDICSACHPFFTGEMKFVDVQGRVDKFRAKLKKAESQQDQVKKRAAKKESKEAKSYQQILREQQASLKTSKAVSPAPTSQN